MGNTIEEFKSIKQTRLPLLGSALWTLAFLLFYWHGRLNRLYIGFTKNSHRQKLDSKRTEKTSVFQYLSDLRSHGSF